MGKRYLSREIIVTDLDAKKEMTTLGEETAPGLLEAPGNATVLEGAYVVASSNFAAAGPCSALIRLEGAGIPTGEEVIVVDGFGAESATGASSIQGSDFVPLNVKADGGADIHIYGEMVGEDVGQVGIGVTLVFNK